MKRKNYFSKTCKRCKQSYGNHGISNKDMPNCPRRKGKGDRFTNFRFKLISNNSKKKGRNAKITHPQNQLKLN